MYKSQNKSKGAAVILVIFFVGFGIVCLWLGSKIGGMYWDKYLLQKTLQAVASDSSSARKHPQEIFNAIQKRIEVQNLRIAPEDFELDASRSPKILKIYFKKDVVLTDFLTVSGETWLSAPIRVESE